jgi:hypothetical protein
MTWRKSSYSSNGEDTCVEVARTGPRRIAARDSKDPHGPRLRIEHAAFARLLTEIKRGCHDIR